MFDVARLKSSMTRTLNREIESADSRYFPWNLSDCHSGWETFLDAGYVYEAQKPYIDMDMFIEDAILPDRVDQERLGVLLNLDLAGTGTYSFWRTNLSLPIETNDGSVAFVSAFSANRKFIEDFPKLHSTQFEKEVESIALYFGDGRVILRFLDKLYIRSGPH